MTKDEAQALLDRLNADDEAYPIGWDGEGFQLEGYMFIYEGAGVWVASSDERPWETLT